MRAAEVLLRSRQALARRLERLGMVEPTSASSPALFDRTQANKRDEAERLLFDCFRESASERFFAGVTSAASLAELELRAPGERARLITLADDIMRHGRFNLLGYKQLCFGNPIDWHFDPVSGRRAPSVHWSRIDPLDTRSIGDSKVIWELNRQQWFITLGQAYRFTADERYAEYFAGRLRAWMQDNPPGRGINWTSSLEVSLRLMSWCWSMFLFRGSRALSPAPFAKMLEWIRAHAQYIERYLSHYFSPNTHLTGEALGLFYAGILFPQLAEAKHWRKLGMRILVQEIERQVFPDGVYFEQSTCYQRYSIEIYLCFLILARRNHIGVPGAVSRRVQSMLDFLLTIRHADGTVPQIGDADGGLLLPLSSSRTVGDCRGVFSVAAALFGRADYAWAAGSVTPEVLWLLGPKGCAAFDVLCPSPPEETPTRLFIHGGYAVMRSGWDADAHRLIFDAGPLGCDVSSGHGHADLLSIQCDVFGQPCLIDPGTYGYTADEGWRDYFRSSTAHNTIVVDGLSQAAPAGLFKWQQRPQARLRRWLSTEAFDLADADHDAYHRLADPVTHRRRVLFSKPRYWLVIDELEAQEEHRIDLYFQFAPAVQVTVGDNGWATACQAEGRECRILVFGSTPLEAHMAKGETDPVQGWVSPDYGQREPAATLRYSTVSRLPLQIVTLICPAENGSCPPPLVAACMEQQRIDLVYEDLVETLHIMERDIIVERQD